MSTPRELCKGHLRCWIGNSWARSRAVESKCATSTVVTDSGFTSSDTQVQACSAICSIRVLFPPMCFKQIARFDRNLMTSCHPRIASLIQRPR